MRSILTSFKFCATVMLCGQAIGALYILAYIVFGPDPNPAWKGLVFILALSGSSFALRMIAGDLSNFLATLSALRNGIDIIGSFLAWIIMLMAGFILVISPFPIATRMSQEETSVLAAYLSIEILALYLMCASVRFILPRIAIAIIRS